MAEDAAQAAEAAELNAIARRRLERSVDQAGRVNIHGVAAAAAAHYGADPGRAVRISTAVWYLVTETLARQEEVIAGMRAELAAFKAADAGVTSRVVHRDPQGRITSVDEIHGGGSRGGSRRGGPTDASLSNLAGGGYR